MAIPAPEGYVPGYRSRVSPSLYEEIFRRVYSGEKCKHIAHEYGVSGRTLQRIVRDVAPELGLPMNHWFALKSRRRKEGWEYIQEVRKYANQEALSNARKRSGRLRTCSGGWRPTRSTSERWSERVEPRNSEG